MMSDKDNMKLFQQVVREFEDDPPVYVWDNIKGKLHERKKRKRVVFIYRMAASVAILIAFGLGYFVTNNTKQKTIVTQQVKSKESNNNTVNVNPVTEQHLTETQQTITNNNKTKSDRKIYTNNVSIASSTESNSNSSSKITTNLIVSDESNRKTDNNLVIQDTKIEKQINNDEQPILTEVTRNDSTIKDNIKQEIVVNQNSEVIRKDTLLLNKMLISNNEPTVKEFLPKEKKNYTNETKCAFGGQTSPFLAYAGGGNTKEDASIFDNPQPNTIGYDNVRGPTRDNKFESDLITFSAGLNFTYPFTGRWSVQSGLYYSRIGQIIEDIPVYEYLGSSEKSYNIYTSAGTIELVSLPSSLSPELTSSFITNSVDTIKIYDINSDLNQSFEYIEFPVLFKYKIIDRRLNFHVLGGISTGFLVGNNAYLLHNNEKYSAGKTEDINSVMYNSITGIGVEYALFKQVSLNVEPVFKYSLRAINKDKSLYYPFSFGLFTGLSYTFK